MFLDETSTQTVMTHRLTERVPRNHGDNLTLLAAIGCEVVLAPRVFSRALDRVIFARRVREWLVPVLRPGQIVVLDNLSVHKNAAAGAAVGCELWPLPVNSPDLNPIELVFAGLNAHLRGATARTPKAVSDAIGAGLDRVTPAQFPPTIATVALANERTTLLPVALVDCQC